jgi:hypothetical protein
VGSARLALARTERIKPVLGGPAVRPGAYAQKSRR